MSSEKKNTNTKQPTKSGNITATIVALIDPRQSYKGLQRLSFVDAFGGMGGAFFGTFVVGDVKFAGVISGDGQECILADAAIHYWRVAFIVLFLRNLIEICALQNNIREQIIEIEKLLMFITHCSTFLITDIIFDEHIKRVFNAILETRQSLIRPDIWGPFMNKILDCQKRMTEKRQREPLSIGSGSEYVPTLSELGSLSLEPTPGNFTQIRI